MWLGARIDAKGSFHRAAHGALCAPLMLGFGCMYFKMFPLFELPALAFIHVLGCPEWKPKRPTELKFVALGGGGGGSEKFG